MSAILKVQKALYERLLQDTEIKNKVKGVFDYVKENQKMPFIALGEITATEYSSKVSKGEEITQTIYIFSDSKGKKETEEIINITENALDEDITILGYDTYMSKIDFIEVYNDQGNYICGEMKFKVRVMEV